MILALPWALLGWLALPLVWWLHRRLRRPPVVRLPALMFLQDEADARTLPRARRFDAELALALAAAALLVLAAAGPRLERRAPRRVVRVALDATTARPGARAYGQRMLAARAALAAALDPADELILTAVPAETGPLTPRPGAAALLATARVGTAAARYVISDEAPPAETAGVQWIAVGDAEVVNQGIVAVAVEADDVRARIFCTLANHAPVPARLVLTAGWVEPDGVREVASGALHLEPDGMRSHTLEVPAGLERVVVRLAAPGGAVHEDDLVEDDSLVLWRVVLTVRVRDLPDAYRAVTHAALSAALGPDGWRELDPRDPRAPDLLVTRRGAAQVRGGWVLELEPVAEGAPAQGAPAGGDALGRGEIARDLATAGVDWVYAPGAAALAADERVLLARGPWPVLLRRGNRVRLAPDPLRGAPRAADTPFWPLLIQNLVEAAAFRGVGSGYRAQGLLDPASSRPGRARIPFDPQALAAAPPSVAADALALRPLLIGAALLCLALLWAAPRLRRRLARRRVAVLGPPA